MMAVRPILRRFILASAASLLSAGLVACSAAAPAVTPVSTLAGTASPTAAQTATSTATVTEVPTSTAAAAPTATATSQPLSLCAPLEGVPLSEMGSPDMLKNPFQMPRPGIDDGHHGADFAYWSRGDRKEMLGLPVYSVLAGTVAGVIKNRQPYGNAVIIETPVDQLPQSWLAAIPFPTPAPTTVPTGNLTCPADPRTYDPQAGRSLYLLYAHLNQTPTVTIGQAVTCGQAIGEVGTTGRSVNPHLHLETRAGPTGATFPEMAHYINDATEAEMRNYCTWRVSGLFQPFDPMKLLSLQQ